ncbi:MULTISPECIES: LysR family transcriptional regulator [Aminobacterium]|uniref:LysR family transcriptional regulator n=2 Tax=Aminobacteriaceae TaxID=3029087 RepID=UPI0004651903|nr:MULTISPECIES: LysR family transcriptional regulator [Aminobacterium]
MTLNQLRVFCATVEEGSFRRAGEKLFLSQPSVSQYIAALEKNYDVKLFNRRGRSFAVTPEGRILYMLACDLLKRADAIPEKFRDMQLLKYGQLHLGTTASYSKTIIPFIIKEFRHKFPHIEICLKINSEKTLFSMIEQDEIELAFLGCNPLLSPPSSCTLKSLGRSPFVLIASPDHPWATRTIIHPSDLLKEPFITYTNKTALYYYLNDFFLNYRLKIPQLIQVDNEEILTGLVSQGIGIGIATEIAVRKDVQHKEVVILPLRGFHSINREIFLVHSTVKGFSYAGWEMGKIAEKVASEVLGTAYSAKD